MHVLGSMPYSPISESSYVYAIARHKAGFFLAMSSPILGYEYMADITFINLFYKRMSFLIFCYETE